MERKPNSINLTVKLKKKAVTLTIIPKTKDSLLDKGFDA